MRRLLQTGAALAVLVAVSQILPVSLSAGIFCNHGLFGCRTCNPCRTCHVNPCRCQTALPAQPQFTMQPQVQTTPVVTYKDVTRTEYRMQAQTVTVPVTTQQTVAVDEGGWQKVWVPKIVSKQVPTTTYQQQIVYQQVPYQVSQRVPQVTYQQTTTMVPQYAGHVAAGCNTCGSGNTWTSPAHNHAGIVGSSPVVLGPIIGAPVASNPVTIGGPITLPMNTQTGPFQSGPVQLGRELQPLNSTSSSESDSSSLGPVPDPAYLEIPQASNSGEWTPVLAATPESADRPTSAPRTAAASGMFVPAPSAASVWRTRIR
ncbi:MAG: hypothetical protein HQ518_08680 [Rhodopirellula sp.]|nr:hypothetical protein [Rhodopirellula sp.]